MDEEKTMTYEEWQQKKEEEKTITKRTLIIALGAFLLGSAMGMNKGRAQAYDTMLYSRRHVN